MNNKQRERLLIEYRELLIKISKLEIVVYSETPKIEKDVRELLEKQHQIMLEYSAILEKRIMKEMEK